MHKPPAALLCLATLFAIQAQQPAPPARLQPIVSPEVSPDRRATFRLRAPNAKAVKVTGEFGPPLELNKEESGMWSGATAPLDPDMYWYTFVVDGVDITDPSNPKMKSWSRGPGGSLLVIPGTGPQAWIEQDVPRGALHENFYQSKATQVIRNVIVYTPPGYDSRRQARYPVLYLLHGNSDEPRSWTTAGRAHVILDNLIAAGRAGPMVIVMPNGHPNPGGGQDSGDAGFTRELLEDVMPLVESQYHIATSREGRAIAGLSMGGGQALSVGLSHLPLFSSVGSFSSGVAAADGAERFASLLKDADAANRSLTAFYIGCGREDPRVEGTRKLDSILTAQGIRHAFRIEPGAHQWIVWRRNLAEFAPMLFRNGGAPAPPKK